MLLYSLCHNCPTIDETLTAGEFLEQLYYILYLLLSYEQCVWSRYQLYK